MDKDMVTETGIRGRGFAVVSSYEKSGIVLPQRKTAASAGYDLEAAERTVIGPQQMAMVPTGLKAYMQPDEMLTIHIRSSLAVKRGLVLMNSVGIVDADYYNNEENEGHIYIALWNRGQEAVVIERGERIAQGIFQKYLTVTEDAAGLGSVRTGGFGSTGRS